MHGTVTYRRDISLNAFCNGGNEVQTAYAGTIWVAFAAECVNCLVVILGIAITIISAIGTVSKRSIFGVDTKGVHWRSYCCHNEGREGHKVMMFSGE